MPTSALGPSQTFRVGRLAVDLPASARYADGSMGGTYNWTPIQEEPWPEELPAEGRERDEARAADWAARLADAEREAEDSREGARLRGGTGDGLVVQDRAVEGAGGRWVRALSWPDYSGRQTTVVVVADAGPARLVARKLVATPRAAAAIERFADALGAYVPAGAAGYGTADWLYLRYGAIARPPAEFEAVAATFTGHPVFEEMTVATSIRLAPPTGPSLVERWRETQAIGIRGLLAPFASGSLRGKDEKIRVGDRAAGPFAGEEVVSAPWIEDNDEVGGWLQAKWEHLGTPDDARDPDASVQARTPETPEPFDDDPAEVLAAWDAILSSIRPTP